MKKIFLTSLILTLFATGAFDLSAQGTGATPPPPVEYELLEPLPCLPGTGNDCTEGETMDSINIDQYILYVYKLFIAITVFLSTVMIIVGGFQWMTSETPFKIGDAKKRIQNAVYGLIAALTSFLILQTIDPRLVQVNTTLEPICNSRNSGPDQPCAPGGLASVANQLQNDLRQLSAENLNRVNSMEQDLVRLRQRQQQLQALVQTTEGDTEENHIELLQVNQQINQITGAQLDLISNGAMVGYYRTAESEILHMRPDQSAAQVDQLIDIMKDRIRNAYRQHAANPAIANNPGARARLEFTRDFLISQIDETRTLRRKIDSYSLARIASMDGETYTGRPATDLRQELITSRVWYNAQLQYLETGVIPAASTIARSSQFNYDEVGRAREHAEFAGHYRRILEERILRINGVLGTTQ